MLSKNIEIKIKATLILHVVLYGCENWIVTLREEQRIRVLENRVLREYLSPKWRIIKFFGDQIEKNERESIFSTCGGHDRCIQNFGGNM
jgi:hypothetical protein